MNLKELLTKPLGNRETRGAQRPGFSDGFKNKMSEIQEEMGEEFAQQLVKALFEPMDQSENEPKIEKIQRLIEEEEKQSNKSIRRERSRKRKAELLNLLAEEFLLFKK